MNWQEILNNILVVVITTVLPVIVGYGINFLNKWIKDKQTNTNNEVLKLTLQSVDDLITTIVTSLTQTVVDVAKKDGTFTKEKGKEVLNEAKHIVITSVCQETKDMIEGLYNMHFDEWVEQKIEEKVNQNKK